jgi:biotin carboxyl carrier protein
MRWGLAALLLAGVVGAATMSHWLPETQKLFGMRLAVSESSAHHEGEAADADHAAHEHKAPDAHAEEPNAHADDEHAHEATDAIVLSPAAQKNIGLHLAKVELKSFERTMSVPGMVVERPGWSELEVTAPMTGAVTRIYPIQGEAVRPGEPLFEVRLTHEDLLQVQTEFLHTVEELDVVRREVERLEKVTVDGAIAGKTLLERKYEQQKGEASLRSQRQALLLHGLSPQQVDDIVSSRTLLQSLTIRAPGVEDTAATDSAAIPLQVQQLKATPGKHVSAGDTLCTLVDYHELYIEGMAFEQDIRAINGAAAAGRKVSALVGSKSTGDDETVAGLRILYLDDQVERESRTFHFYVSLPNRVVRQDKTTDGRGFVYWQFKPGQRIRILLPVEQWTDRIVLPVEAVAQDGAEAYVFAFDGDDFQRKPVHVEYRDQDSVVIANDGALQLGTTVAVSGAHQIQLAMKNKSGGGVDPHAGHNH